MPSFENQGEVKKMEIGKQEISEEKWRETVGEAIDFTLNTLTFDLFEGKIHEDELGKDELREFQRLKEILGQDVINYLAGIESWLTNISGGSVPDKTMEESLTARRREYARIESLTRDKLIEEVKKHAADRDARSKVKEEIKKRE